MRVDGRTKFFTAHPFAVARAFGAGWKPAPQSRRGGFTLLELIVVIGLLTLLMGMGVGTYVSMSRTSKEESMASQIDVMLRQVRNSAVSSQSPAYLAIDPENKRVTPWSTKTIALWHFEDCDDFFRTSGTRHGAVLRGARPNKFGKIGKCVRLAPGGFIDAGDDPDFDLDDGGYIEAYIRPSSGDFSGDNFVFSKDGAYSLRVGAKNGVKGVLIGRIAGDGKRHSTEVFSKTYKVAGGRWTKVAFAWDRNVTRILVDDLVVATGPGATPPTTSNPLLIGHESSSFDGLVDEVRVLSAVSGGTLDLPNTFKLTHTAGPWNAVYFGPDGALDMRFHAGPVEISIENQGRVRAVTVDMFGNTKRLELENKDKSAESDDSSDTKRKPKAVQK